MARIHHSPPRPAPNPLREPVTHLLDMLPTATSFPANLDTRLRHRLGRRVARALQASRQLVTLRRECMTAETVAAGVTLRQLYASRAAMRRPGEPARAVLVELAPGSNWALPGDDSVCREWLVLRGRSTIGEHEFGRLDFLRESTSELRLSSADGAAIYLREIPDALASAATAQCESADNWLPFGPGISRRLLWTDGRQAAMLYHAVAGAAVPHHGHGHDEECLMVEGELFLDDVLLLPGDYQLVPAGTEHRDVNTDTGCLLYTHGDLDLELVPG